MGGHGSLLYVRKEELPFKALCCTDAHQLWAELGKPCFPLNLGAGGAGLEPCDGRLTPRHAHLGGDKPGSEGASEKGGCVDEQYVFLGYGEQGSDPLSAQFKAGIWWALSSVPWCVFSFLTSCKCSTCRPAFVPTLSQGVSDGLFLLFFLPGFVLNSQLGRLCFSFKKKKKPFWIFFSI